MVLCHGQSSIKRLLFPAFVAS